CPGFVQATVTLDLEAACEGDEVEIEFTAIVGSRVSVSGAGLARGGGAFAVSQSEQVLQRKQWVFPNLVKAGPHTIAAGQYTHQVVTVIEPFWPSSCTQHPEGFVQYSFHAQILRMNKPPSFATTIHSNYSSNSYNNSNNSSSNKGPASILSATKEFMVMNYSYDSLSYDMSGSSAFGGIGIGPMPPRASFSSCSSNSNSLHGSSSINSHRTSTTSAASSVSFSGSSSGSPKSLSYIHPCSTNTLHSRALSRSSFNNPSSYFNPNISPRLSPCLSPVHPGLSAGGHSINVGGLGLVPTPHSHFTTILSPKKLVPIEVAIPSETLHFGQTVPVTITVHPFMEGTMFSGQEVVIMDAHFGVLETRHARSANSSTMKDKVVRERVDLFVPNTCVGSWPQSRNGWTRTVNIKMPTSMLDSGRRNSSSSSNSNTSENNNDNSQSGLHPPNGSLSPLWPWISKSNNSNKHGYDCDGGNGHDNGHRPRSPTMSLLMPKGPSSNKSHRSSFQLPKSPKMPKSPTTTAEFRQQQQQQQRSLLTQSLRSKYYDITHQLIIVLKVRTSGEKDKQAEDVEIRLDFQIVHPLPGGTDTPMATEYHPVAAFSFDGDEFLPLAFEAIHQRQEKIANSSNLLRV
ncbi:hypothetical protein BX616_000656, partial [Lobosporangium transversale]